MCLTKNRQFGYDYDLFILIIYLNHLYYYSLLMKRGEFSYENGRSQSHASLSRYRRTNEDTLTRDTNKERPNVKFFTINH